MTARTAHRTVVMGVIDDGIAFGHERFRKKAATRVEYWWLQDGQYLPGPTALPYGRELAKLIRATRIDAPWGQLEFDQDTGYAIAPTYYYTVTAEGDALRHHIVEEMP